MVADRRARPCDEAPLDHLGLNARTDLTIAGEILLGCPILHKLHGCQKPPATPDVSYVRVVSEYGHQCDVEPIPHSRGVLRKTLALDDLDILQCNGTASRMGRVSVGMHPAVCG